MATNLSEALAADAAPGETALRLPAELTIYTAAETRGAWLTWLAGDAAGSADLGHDDRLCLVDGSACDEVDAAGLQLLVALAHSLARQHRRLVLQQPADALRKGCAELGLESLLHDPHAREALA